MPNNFASDEEFAKWLDEEENGKIREEQRLKDIRTREDEAYAKNLSNAENLKCSPNETTRKRGGELNSLVCFKRTQHTIEEY
jgi:hypothetical protein